MPHGILKIYQEDWYPFANLPAALAEFTRQTGIATELSWDTVGVGTIEHMFDEMLGSFEGRSPTYDLVCTDEVILQAMDRNGLVVDVSPLMQRDGITLDDVAFETRRVIEREGRVLGLPCISVSNMIMYRRDLLQKYDLPVPRDWDELRRVGETLQDAVRRDEGRADFYGFETRGAPGGGHSVYTIGCFTGSFGATWLKRDGTVHSPDDAQYKSLDAYVSLLKAVAPPDQGELSFVEMRRDMASGRVGIIMDCGMEYAAALRNNPRLADRVGIAMVPAGPLGRAPNLYAPPWAIPANTDMKEEAWQLAKFLTGDRQLLEDGLRSDAIETSSLPVLYSSAFDRHFRSDLLETVRSTRAVQREERPFSAGGIAGCKVVGDNVHYALVGRLSVEAALDAIASGLRELSPGPATTQ
jgi:ABC-type glycerol-3-phosphate transport system substrate-binding protein